MADNPTDIGKNKSTVSSMIDALRLEIRELQKFATVQEDLIVEGGNPNANIKVPKKLTAEQTIQFMKQFPSGFPLADENAFFGIARALTLQSPELFDVDSFDAYEKKFGSTMEMQEKGASASKNITVGKPLKAANEPVAAKGKSVADLDPKTATLREVAEAYAEKSGRGKAFIGPTLQYFKDIADEPGSAMRLFEKDADGFTLLSKTFKNTEENAPIKASMQNLRQVGLLLKENVGPDTPEYKLLPDESPDTPLNKRIFGRAEPPKYEAQIAISTDPKKQAQLFEGVAKYLDDPKTRPAALAIIFNMNTGLRPNAVLNITLDKYYPDTGAIYIPADVKGAKNRFVNIPLNPVADSILQELLAGKKPGDRFFTKPNGDEVKTEDMNKILKAVKVPQIMYDQSTKTFYDSLHPDDGPGKTGTPLLRNVHSSVALSLGIPQERTAYLQGRSLKAASKGSTGEIATYQAAYPGDVSDVDRDFSSKISSFYGKSAKDVGFDIESKIPMPEARITTQTAGYEGYFDLPVQEEATISERPTVQEPDLYPDAHKNALEKGIDLKKVASKMVDVFKKSPKVIGTAIGVETVRQIVEEPAAFALETAAELAGKAVGLPAGPAAAVPLVMQSTPAGEGSALTGPGSLQEQRQKEMEQVVMEDVDIPFIQRRQEREEAVAPIERQVEEGFATRIP